jgi:hypothetical protein
MIGFEQDDVSASIVLVKRIRSVSLEKVHQQCRYAGTPAPPFCPCNMPMELVPALDSPISEGPHLVGDIPD